MVLSVIRLVAFGLVFTSLLYLGSYVFFAAGRQSSGDGDFHIILKGIPLVLGLALGIKSRAIARRLTEDLDD
jgi:hypothetical protein